MKVKCKLGAPHHGWLPVKVTIGDFNLEFEASDVPTNPVDLLTASLLRSLNGLESEVWWHLEPASYYFTFTPLEAEHYLFSISYANSHSDAEIRHEKIKESGSRDEVIVPFWRAIKEFVSHSYQEPHWPPTYDLELEKLTSAIRV